MTTLEEDVAVEVEVPTETEGESKKGRKRDLDFTKVRESHEGLAAYVNERSGLPPVTANQVKAILTLKTDFAATPEQEAKREEAKAKRAAANAKYAGMTPEQIQVEKAAERQEKQAEKLRKRVEEAMLKAKAIREGKEASGEDVAAAVAAEQASAEPEKTKRFGRNR